MARGVSRDRGSGGRGHGPDHHRRATRAGGTPRDTGTDRRPGRVHLTRACGGHVRAVGQHHSRTGPRVLGPGARSGTQSRGGRRRRSVRSQCDGGTVGGHAAQLCRRQHWSHRRLRRGLDPRCVYLRRHAGTRRVDAQRCDRARGYLQREPGLFDAGRGRLRGVASRRAVRHQPVEPARRDDRARRSPAAHAHAARIVGRQQSTARGLRTPAANHAAGLRHPPCRRPDDRGGASAGGRDRGQFSEAGRVLPVSPRHVGGDAADAGTGDGRCRRRSRDRGRGTRFRNLLGRRVTSRRHDRRRRAGRGGAPTGRLQHRSGWGTVAPRPGITVTRPGRLPIAALLRRSWGESALAPGNSGTVAQDDLGHRD